MNVGALLAMIDLGAVALPVFQRGYVWNRDQVRGLMGSLYKGHPVGSLLTWQTLRTPQYAATSKLPQDRLASSSTVNSASPRSMALFEGMFPLSSKETLKPSPGSISIWTQMFFNSMLQSLCKTTPDG